MPIKFEKTGDGKYLLDVQGYVCPHPQLYTKKSLEKINPGEVLEVIFDNPSSSESIEAMVDSSEDEIVKKRMEDGKFVWAIKKAE